MSQINDNFIRLPEDYLFSKVGRRIREFESLNPDLQVIRMGIGDVTRPICPAAISAMHCAVDEMSDSASFHGYGPEQGYPFLREAIADYDYRRKGLNISSDDIFISDGAKSDLGNIGDLFSADCRVAVTDPVYPVYVDSNVIAGRAGTFAGGRWSRIIYIPCLAENDFNPKLPVERPDLIYLCYPNNPTGTVLNREQLSRWVEYARANGSVILFDSAYESYISCQDIPHSIYEIDGAEEVAIEFRSFSKTAGFTGLRCGYTVIPEGVTATSADGREISLRSLWNRRQSTKFNGASYIVQRGAAALYTPEGRRQLQETISYYMRNATLLRKSLVGTGIKVYGGENAPYLWVKAPGGMSSWEFFDFLLHKLQIAGTPGVGFGPAGEGYLRLTAFNTHENTVEAAERLKKLIQFT